MSGPNAHCLQVSHLTLAWKTCTSKLDSAVSAEVYQLLVSILPSLPDDLAIKLLTSIQSSLHSSEDDRDYLFEVAEFCSALADMNPNEMEGIGSNNNPVITAGISDGVRVKILKLLWAVLTHPGASSLKCYEILKNYVTNELRVEPMGTSQRHIFLESCTKALSHDVSDICIDEDLSLTVINLTKFVLGACPTDQAVAQLVFQDLTAYLNRRSAPQQLTRKVRLLSVTEFVIEPYLLDIIYAVLLNQRFSFVSINSYPPSVHPTLIITTRWFNACAFLDMFTVFLQKLTYRRSNLIYYGIFVSCFSIDVSSSLVPYIIGRIVREYLCTTRETPVTIIKERSNYNGGTVR